MRQHGREDTGAGGGGQGAGKGVTPVAKTVTNLAEVSLGDGYWTLASLERHSPFLIFALADFPPQEHPHKVFHIRRLAGFA
jgi:hypothetical protein